MKRTLLLVALLACWAFKAPAQQQSNIPDVLLKDSIIIMDDPVVRPEAEVKKDVAGIDKRLKELPLETLAGNGEAFRFIWLRTFHHPIVISIKNTSGIYKLHWAIWSGAGGYGWGKLAKQGSKDLSSAQWKLFKSGVDSAYFWELPAYRNDVGNDGSDWILEGQQAGKYHVVQKWTPQNPNRFYQCCYYLIELAGIKIDAREMY